MTTKHTPATPTPARAAFVVERHDAEERFRRACDELATAKAAYLADPVEGNLLAFTLALRKADAATHSVLLFDDTALLRSLGEND